MSADTTAVREALIDTACRMASSGLNRGTAGNLSVRATENDTPGFLITPTGMRYEDLMPEDVVFMHLDGSVEGRRKPSSEWRFHRDIYAARPDCASILHAHSPFATTLACLRLDIPAFHYMIARFGGSTVRCAEYATFGTQALSDAALSALDKRSACLLSNHGMIVLGQDLSQALAYGIEFEELCEQYWRACQLGQPAILDAAEMAIIIEKFSTYGQQEPRR